MVTYALYRESGTMFLRHAPTVDVPAGTPIEIASGFWGISALDVEANEPGDFRIEGVFRGVKTTESDVIAEGDLLTFTPGSGFAADAAGVWRAMDASPNGQSYVLVEVNVASGSGSGSPEGTAVKSTGEAVGLVLTADGADGASWEASLGNGDMLVSVYDADDSVAEQLVGKTATQTLTNKTLTAPDLGTPTALDLTNALNLAEAQVTAHESALTITASQVSDFQTTVSANTDVAASKVVTDFITITQPVDLDTIETDVATNTAKVSCTAANIDAAGGALTTDKLDVFAATSSAELASVITQTTGTGNLVFSAAPTFTTPTLGTPITGDLTTCTGYEGTNIKSTGESGGTKYLKEDGLGGATWGTPAGGITAVVQDTAPQLGGVLLTNQKQIVESQGASLTAASPLNVGTDGNYFLVNGTTTISSISARPVGTRIRLRFASALSLVHGGSSLILPTSTTIAVAAGDHAEFVYTSTNVWRCVQYTRATGNALKINVVNDTAPSLGGTLLANNKQIRAAIGTPVAAAATTNVLLGNFFVVSGNTTIDGFSNQTIGTTIYTRFTGTPTLTNSANFVLPTGSDIIAAVDDTASFVQFGSSPVQWRCLHYQRKDGTALVGGAGVDWTADQGATNIDPRNFGAAQATLTDNGTPALDANDPFSHLVMTQTSTLTVNNMVNGRIATLLAKGAFALNADNFSWFNASGGPGVLDATEWTIIDFFQVDGAIFGVWSKPAADPDWTVNVSGSVVHDDNISASSVTQHETALEGVLDHDDLQGFVANEHIDWTASSAGTIDATNYVGATTANVDAAGAAMNSDFGTGVETFLATPSSANLRAAITDGSGTGVLLFADGALGTPASAVLTNATALPPTTGVAFSEQVLSPLTGATTLDADTNLQWYGAITGNITLSVDNMVTNGKTCVLVLKPDGAHTITIGTAADTWAWSDGTGPGTMTANKVVEIYFRKSAADSRVMAYWTAEA